ncbi:2Fe-2S iron-sulfur cluster binding domain-containing protein [Paraburkholderia sp. LEh10]|uniref:2Fe-2S iron-sulfur cluster-binding protein n=1 Tax=Paraburkholderia sp. LEh10 TaxID=2821353 RepID=UPI001AE310A0|nr:2Fe-2S iron-sulfur cluster-binding protein [Paraburkholderia sp. LEh10]MBP0592162.1 2Fe-2S iron-sulfur cluster binding domain-containing protein [Paraburkholderia sp. LEh10]
MSDAAHRITLANSDVSFDCDEHDTVLRSALRAGIAFPYECNVGACGNCKFELIEGAVDMKWSDAPAWTDKDRARNRYLGCQCAPRGDCTIRLRPSPQYAPLHAPRRVTGTLAGRRSITHDIEEFRFALSAQMPFEPGQYALLNLPRVSGVRAYSMSNIADEPRMLHFQVRRVPNGRGSSVLFDALETGAQVEIDGPYGMAYLRRNVTRDVLCVAGGSGLAPMISIARGIVAEPALAGVQLHFLYGGRTPRDICGRDMLASLPGFDERIRFEAAVSDAAPGDACDPWTGHVGFVHELADAMFGERLRDMEIYFAGPPAMGQAIQRTLLARKVPFEQVHFDQFY